MPQTADYYKILGVSRTATTDEIRAAYRSLARKLHPDVNKAPDASQRFNEVQEAYEVLSDPEKRKSYDQFGRDGVYGRTAGGPGPGSAAGGASGGARTYTWSTAGGAPDFDVGDFSSIFEEVLGGRGSRGFAGAGRAPGPRPAPPPAKARDVHHAIDVPFLTAAKGGTEELRITRPDGTSESVTVRIPAGIESGAKLRLRGRGEPAQPGTAQRPGDLILTITLTAHPWFQRDGLNLTLEAPITIAEAALGATITVPLLEGRADLRIPAGTSSGQKLRIKGKGIRDEKGRQGDFFAVIQIAAPRDLAEPDRAMLEDLGARLKNPRETLPWADIVR